MWDTHITKLFLKIRVRFFSSERNVHICVKILSTCYILKRLQNGKRDYLDSMHKIFKKKKKPKWAFMIILHLTFTYDIKFYETNFLIIYRFEKRILDMEIWENGFVQDGDNAMGLQYMNSS